MSDYTEEETLSSTNMEKKNEDQLPVYSEEDEAAGITDGTPESPKDLELGVVPNSGIAEDKRRCCIDKKILGLFALVAALAGLSYFFYWLAIYNNTHVSKHLTSQS